MLPTRTPVLAAPPDPDPMTRSYVVAAAPPLVIEDAYPHQQVLADLCAYWGEAEPLSRESDADAERVLAPDVMLPTVVGLLSTIAEHFDLPYAVSHTRMGLARYGPGTFRDWHVDAGPGTPSSNWTVAFSLLLNDEFSGGDLEVHPHGPVTLRPGDAVGFTSRTAHRVWPVEHGERYVLLGFGGYGEADA